MVAASPEPSQHAFPELFLGNHKDTTQRWRRVLRQAIKAGSLAAALADQKMVRFCDVPDHILISGRAASWQKDICLYDVFENVVSVAEYRLEVLRDDDRVVWYNRIKSLAFEGMDHFWFQLGMLNPTQNRWFPQDSPFDVERPAISRFFLRRLMDSWSDFIELSGRFNISWPFWAIRTARLCFAADGNRAFYDKLLEVPPPEFHRLVSEWLAHPPAPP